MASACFWIIGSVLERFARLSAVRIPATAKLTMTMKTINSTRVTPRALLRSAIHIAGFRGNVDYARRVVRDRAGQRDGVCRGGTACAVEAEASHRRERHALGRVGRLQFPAAHRMHHRLGRAAI